MEHQMKKKLSDINVVLDRSGSMESLCAEVIGWNSIYSIIEGRGEGYLA